MSGPKRPLRTLLLTAAAVVAGGLAALPASASADVVVVTPLISGSGSVTSSGGTCTATDKPNGTVTGGCAAAVGVSAMSTPAFVPLTATAPASPAGHWSFVRWDGNAPGCSGTTSASCTVVAIGGSFTAIAVFTDTVGPTVATPTAVLSTVNDRSVTLSYTGNEPLSAASCSVDNGAFADCPTGSQTLTLPEGGHTFRVRGTDLSGNVGAISSTASFRIIDTALVDGPTDFSNQKSPAFVFSTLAGLTFECAVDNVVLASCGAKGPDGRGTKQLDGLADGVHTFRVRARDGGDFDRVPSVRTWTIDTVAPVASLATDTGPGEGALQAVDRETFSFFSSEANSTFQCRLDAAAFAACAPGIVLERLAAGPHRFEVRAIDRAGNASAVVARNWSVAPQDRDGDGFNALIDCNDASPAIRPGAVEVAGNAVDENCDGIVAPGAAAGGGATPKPPARVKATLSSETVAGKRTTRFTRLQVKGLPRGTTVRVTCKGKGCPGAFKGKGYTKKNASGTLSLAKFLNKSLRAGDVLTIVVSRPGATSAVMAITMRAGKKPSVTQKCQPPGAAKPAAC
jgi:hypothetical protein